MRRYKLPFNITLERKYNNINIEEFVLDWNTLKKNRKNRMIMLDNDLHIELGKFKTYDLSMSEVIDLGMRYALGKQEFRKLAAELIDKKKE
ncbi:hypothetical protein [Chryseobacterium potabilaquae]|uniref:Uncharacterized protein n=1 Tax=Chryseobacterium potabilaquae TaxID=2675057 RepID=A0A6N4X7M1_9FLAO|nr:hypothetical protein [Chryseobacterium potabilaquae]CAA7197005.1 hypothetical protein CHRY9293_03063 [Chryseobacterium potabilaquae]